MSQRPHVWRTLRRLAVWVVGTALVLFFMAAAGLGFVLWTETGTRMVMPMVKGFVPTDITWDSLAGRLAGPLVVTGLHVPTPEVDVRVASAMIDLRILPLLNRTVHLDSVRVTGAHAELRKREADPSVVADRDSILSATKPKLPLAIIIDTLILNGGTVNVTGVAEVSDLSVHFAGTPDDYRVFAEARVRTAGDRSGAIHLRGRGSLESIIVDSLHAQTKRGDVSAEGDAVWYPEPSVRLRIRAWDLDPSGFDPHLADWPGRVDLAASAEATFSQNGPLVHVDLDTLQGTLRELPISGRALVDYQHGHAQVDPVELDWGALRLRASGAYGDSLRFSFVLNVPDLSQVMPDAYGSFEARGDLSGTSSEPSITARFSGAHTGWRDFSVVRFTGDVEFERGATSRSRIRMSLDSARAADILIDSVRADVSGTRPQHAFGLHVAALETELTLTGTGGWFDSLWEGQLSEAGIRSLRVHDWTLDAPVDLRMAPKSVSASPACFTSDSGQICLGGSLRDDRLWKAEFTCKALALAWANQLLPEGMALSGPLDASVRIERGRTTSVWALVEAGPGSVVLPGEGDADSIFFDRSQLRVEAGSDSTAITLASGISRVSGAAGFRIQGSILMPAVVDRALARNIDPVAMFETEPWSARVDMSEATLENLGILLPEHMQMDGSLELHAALTSTPQDGVTGDLDITVPTGDVHVAGYEDTTMIKWEEARLAVHIDTGGVGGLLSTALLLEDRSTIGHFDAELRVPEVHRLRDIDSSTQYALTLDADFDMRIMDVLVPQLSHTTGRFRIDSRVEGRGRDLDVLGTAEIEGRTTLSALGITLDSLYLTAEGTPDGVVMSGGARSGGGQITLEGNIARVPSADAPTAVRIRGTDFLLLSRPQAVLYSSPDLNVSFTGKQLDITGTLRVPRARFALLEVPESAVPVSKDVVIVGEKAQADSARVAVSARVQVELGNHVFFQGFGLNTYLDGQIAAIAKPGAVTRGQGELTLREGRYRGYGQDLTVDPGRLIFDGPIDNPRLDVLAYRRADDNTRAGFKVTGSVQSPEIRLYSDPAKNDEETMSYILFGRSMGENSESDQMRASDAAALVGGNILAAQAATKVGLDDARIEPGSKQNDAAFYAGKYLSPKLYVAYGTGIYESINTLRVRYILSKHFTLQAETGTRETVDIIYQIER